MKTNMKNKKKGFTLIELIVVIAILVALMLILVPKLTGFTNDATKTANQANARAIYTALKASETATDTGMYKMDTEEHKAICTAVGTGVSVEAYVKFWGDAAPKEIGSCKYNGNAVTYGTGDTAGTYPADATEVK